MFKKPKINVANNNQAVEEEILTSNFSLKVAEHVIQQHMSKNKSVVCSPVSIDAILSILALAAENSTLDQLLTLLGHGDVRELNTRARKLGSVLKGSHDTNDNEDAPKISFVNGLWLDQRFSLKTGFQKVLKDVHKTEARVVDFVNRADRIVNEINSWAEQETKGLIKQILSRNNINCDTVLILGNALYFNGNWHNYFKSEHTKDDDFNLLNGDKIRVPMMNQWNEYFEYRTSDSYQVLKMPYKIGDNEDETKIFSMYVFLPRENNGLPNLMKEINIINPNLFVKGFKSMNITYLSIPKFKFECDVELKVPMKQLGLLSPFEETCKDFSGMTDIVEPIYVSDISQKCFVETNECGTKAAAFTWCQFAPGSILGNYRPSPPPINFVADHPFMFVIREDVSGAILFVGTVLDPR